LHVIPFELPRPRNEADFERMCLRIYGVVYSDPTAKINGRKGQAQGGVDVFVTAQGIGRIGIQCKKYWQMPLEWRHVVEEVDKADKFETPIKRLLIATTSPNDAGLLKKVQNLSDEREKTGKFGVEIEFWEDIQARIDAHPILQDSYNPQAVGAVFHRQANEMAYLKEIAVETRDHVATLGALPIGREDSVNKIITGQLDRTNDLIKAGRYRDALEHVDHVGTDLGPFDSHQKARWYLQRGLCLWFSQDRTEEAAALFFKAYQTYPEDERMVAARIRGLMLTNDLEGALSAGREGEERFPVSVQVWLAYANAKMRSGEPILLATVPANFRNEPDVLLFAAISAREQGDFAEAARLAEESATCPEAGFFSKAAFLRMALEDCTREPVWAQFGIVPADRFGRLGRAVAQFEARKQILWDVQSNAAVEAAAHLGFAFIILKEPAKALEVAGEAEALKIISKDIRRVKIQALDELGLKNEALEAAKENLADLPAEALLAACEIAANRGDLGFVESAAEIAAENFSGNVEIGDDLATLRWVAMAQGGGKEELVSEILATSQSLVRPISLCAAGRLLRWAQRPIEAAEMVDRAAALIGEQASASDKLLVADLLFLFERWAEAALLYEKLLASAGRGPSSVHARLLECYVESDNRAKAKGLLRGFPDGWADHDETRRCAINLGHKAGDWKFLEPLTERQVVKAPGVAVSWLFRLAVLLHTAEPAAFQAEIGKVPEDVSGSIRNLGMLAGLELRYDEGARGLRRSYRLARRNLDEPEAISAYMINFLTGKLPPFDRAPSEIAQGCSASLQDKDGSIETVILDPADAGSLPKRDGFFSAEDPDVASLLGKKSGEMIELPLKAGGTRSVRVLEIGSAYDYMAKLAMEKSRRLGGLPHLKSLSIGQTGDPERDLAYIHQEISRVAGVSEQIFGFYASGAMTLSRLAKALGRSPVEICMGWPSDAPPLFVGTGTGQERHVALEMLKNGEHVFVADSTALSELVLHGVGHALGALPKILVSSATKEIVDALVTAAETDESVGTMFADEGRLRFIEFDEKRKEKQRLFAREVAAILERCEVLPAYGDLGESKEARGFAEVMGLEEKEMLLLAKEHGAILLTLDGRVRMLARLVYGIEGVWPQVLVMRAYEVGLVTQDEASAFAVGEFLSNRSFVSLGPNDLLWMISQGDSWLQSGVTRFKRYLASADTERDSAFEVSLNFLDAVASRSYCQLGAFGELLSHLAEAMFRRPDCPEDWEARLIEFVGRLLTEDAPPEHLLPAANHLRNQDLILGIDLMKSRVREALERSKQGPRSDPIRVRVLHCGHKPWLIVDKSSPGEEVRREISVPTDAPNGEDGTIEGHTSATKALE